MKESLVFYNEYKEKDKRINANTYFKILETNFLPFYTSANVSIRGKLVFHRDNAPIHTAKKNYELV